MERILRSTLITLSVSALISFIFLAFGFNFWGVFALTTILQFITFFVIGSVVEYVGQIRMREIEVAKLKELAKQQIEVECPCDKKVREMVDIVLGERNTYKCSSCNKINAVYVTATTAATNVPIVETKIK